MRDAGPVLALMLLTLCPHQVGAQADGRAERVAPNLVRITTTFSSPALHDSEDERGIRRGYGLIVRQSGDSLFVVTALPVVLHEDPSFETVRVSAELGGSNVPSEATPLRYGDVLDLALLVVRAQPDVGWRLGSAVDEIRGGERVSVVGGDWSRGLWNSSRQGQVSSTSGVDFFVDVADGERGLLGGAVTTDAGIAGMVVNDEGNQLTALSTGSIRRVVLGTWLAVDELDPSSTPSLALQAGLGRSFESDPVPQLALPPRWSLSAELLLSDWVGIGVEVARGGTQSADLRDRASARRYQYQALYTQRSVSLRVQPGAERSIYASLYATVGRLDLQPEMSLDGGPWQAVASVPGVSYVPDTDAWLYGIGFSVSQVVGPGFLLGGEMRLTRTTTRFLTIGIENPFEVEDGNDWLFEFGLRTGFVWRPRLPRQQILH